MKQINRYYKYSKISERKFRLILRYFATDLNAFQTATLAGLTHKSVNDLFLKIRLNIVRECERLSASSFNQSEASGPTTMNPLEYVKNAGEKAVIFGITEQGGSIYTEAIPIEKSLFSTVVKGNMNIENIISREKQQKYDGILSVINLKFFRLPFSIADSKTHPHESERFWSFTKRRLQRFNGVPDHTFYLHLKECEYRYNNRREDLNRLLLNLLERNPI